MATRLEKVRQLQDTLIARATGGDTNNEEYSKLRIELLRDSAVRDLLPQFVKTCDELSKFWGFIKLKFSTYQDRRAFIWKEFSSLVASLEQNIIAVVQTLIATLDLQGVVFTFDSLHCQKKPYS